MNIWARFDQLFERFNALCDEAWKLADEASAEPTEPGTTTTTTTTRTANGETVTTVTRVTRTVRRP